MIRHIVLSRFRSDTFEYATEDICDDLSGTGGCSQRTYLQMIQTA